MTDTRSKECIEVLVVEDNPGDRDLVLASLEEDAGKWHAVPAATLGAASECLRQRSVDVILLDLDLPDSHGMETLRQLLTQAPTPPIVVITGFQEEAFGTEALKNGAQDYLVKGRVGSELLRRSLRYAVERHSLLQQIETTRQRRAQEREESALSSLGAPTRVAAALYGSRPLQEVAPAMFAELVGEYGRLLRMALESQVVQITSSFSTELRALADHLGGLAASPRDIIEVHKHALRAASAAEAVQKAQALTEEGRYCVLELMGQLASFYRRQVVSSWPPTVSDAPAAG